jgi:site-specific DNA-methyltransferase (cytosine-N4-specific)
MYKQKKGPAPYRITCNARYVHQWIPTERMHRLCITSPPYWMLRDYGHPLQIGLEDTPEKYVENLCSAFLSVWSRVTGDGSLIIVIGDSYYGGGSTTKYGNDFSNFSHKSTLAGTHPGGSIRPVKPRVHEKFKTGEQIGIPWMLADGLRGVGWMIRQVSIWHKPNPMPGPFRKRLTSSHEYIIHATKSMKYYCDRCGFDDGVRIMRDVITCSVGRGGHRHNAGFPKELVFPYIKALSAPGDMVLDPFCGAGTVGDVCVDLGRDATLCDINPLKPA